MGYFRSAVGWTFVLGAIITYLIMRPMMTQTNGNEVFAPDLFSFIIAFVIWLMIAAVIASDGGNVESDFHHLGRRLSWLALFTVLLPIGILLLFLGALGGSQSVDLSPGETLHINLKD